MREHHQQSYSEIDYDTDTNIRNQPSGKKFMVLIAVFILVAAFLCVAFYEDILISFHYVQARYFSDQHPNFTYQVWLENADGATRQNTIMKVYYDDVVIDGPQPGTNPIHVGFTNDSNGTDKCFYFIHGWVTEPTEIRMDTYSRDPETGEWLELIQSQTILVRPGLISYDIKVIDYFSNISVI